MRGSERCHIHFSMPVSDPRHDARERSGLTRPRRLLTPQTLAIPPLQQTHSGAMYTPIDGKCAPHQPRTARPRPAESQGLESTDLLAFAHTAVCTLRNLTTSPKYPLKSRLISSTRVDVRYAKPHERYALRGCSLREWQWMAMKR